MYIYKFTHISTDRCYIGQTWEEIYGPEVAASRRKSMTATALQKKLNMEAAV